MKQILSKFVMGMSLAVTLTACDYTNEFNGSYNNTPAKLSAYSSNIDRYCVALTLTAGTETKKSFISAQAVFDTNNQFATKAFNTKGAGCSANLTEYLVGTRTVVLLATTPVHSDEHLSQGICRTVYFNQYTIQETLNFEIRNNADDALVGSFAGSANATTYMDSDHPTNYGPTYQCGPVYQPGPYPYPRPQPYPYPRPQPYPYPPHGPVGPGPGHGPGPGPRPHP